MFKLSWHKNKKITTGDMNLMFIAKQLEHAN